ncbi:MAG: glycosyltransferase family 39 protein, partial [bacterium]|nr:glycosyltransferase family 39 protein [bacterium]
MDKFKITALHRSFLVYLILGFIIFGASYIRLSNIRGFQVFLGDQGRDVLIVKKMIDNHRPTFIGPTASVGGFFLGPFYYYLMVIPLILAQMDPVGPAIMVALLSIATTLMCFIFAKRYVSSVAGLIASALYAISSLVVEYARSSWNPNVLPFFSLALVMACAYLLEKDSKYKEVVLFVIGACLGIIIQLHYAVWGMYLFAACIYFAYKFKDIAMSAKNQFRKTFEEIMVIFSGIFLMMSPFLLFEIYHKFPNLSNISKFVFNNRGGGFSGGYSYWFIIQDTLYRLVLRLLAGGNNKLADFIIILFVFATLYAIYKISIVLKSKDNSIINIVKNSLDTKLGIGLFVLVLWLICGVGLWGFYKKSIFDYYYSYMYPLPILLLGSLLGLFYNKTYSLIENTKKYAIINHCLGLTIVLFIAIIFKSNY